MNLQQKIKSLKEDLKKLEKKYNIKFNNPEIEFKSISIAEQIFYEDQETKRQVKSEVQNQIYESVWESVQNTLENDLANSSKYTTKINI